MNHFLEALIVSLNLSVFGFSVWNSLSTQKLEWKTRLSIFLGYFIFYAFITIFIAWRQDFQIYFLLKKFLFTEKWLLLSLLASATFWLLWKEQKDKVLIWITPFLSWFLFFLLFGREKFFIGTWEFSGLHLFQAQNPILFVCFFPFLFISKRLVLLSSFFIILSFGFGYSYYDELRLRKKLSITPIYMKYSACEFFLSGSFLIVEEERGVYFFVRQENISEPIYKFTMKPLRYLSIYERQYIQKLVQEFQFPIVLKEEETIFIYEMYKRYRGELFKVEINIYELTGKVTGPIF